MLRYLLTFLLLTTPAFAQKFDLRTLPQGYSFASQSADHRTDMRFVRQEGERFLFEETTTYNDGTMDAVLVWVNAQSQSTAWGKNGDETRFGPHDCAPSQGTCFYTWFHPEDTFEMKTVTKLVGNIWVSDEYFKDNGAWVLWERDCTIYDAYGFWVDYVRIDNEGRTSAGVRVRPAPDQLDELWKICLPPQLTS